MPIRHTLFLCINLPYANLNSIFLTVAKEVRIEKL